MAVPAPPGAAPSVMVKRGLVSPLVPATAAALNGAAAAVALALATTDEVAAAEAAVPAPGAEPGAVEGFRSFLLRFWSLMTDSLTSIIFLTRSVLSLAMEFRSSATFS